jgi:hypothetical protein
MFGMNLSTKLDTPQLTQFQVMQLQNCDILKKVASKTTFFKCLPRFLARMQAKWDKGGDKTGGGALMLLPITSQYVGVGFQLSSLVYTNTVDVYTEWFTTWGHTAGGDFLGLCDQKSSYKHVSDFGRLRSYDRLKLRIEGNDHWQ